MIMNINEVKKLLSKYNVESKKHYGQNFLLDDSIIKGICDYSDITSNTLVVEIGPGLGFLTNELARRSKQVICYEIDKDMVNILNQEVVTKYDNVTIKEMDFLKCNLDEDLSNYSFDKAIVVANLPYYITTPILLKILEESKSISSLTVMVQKEVGDRLCGQVSTKDYNALSVLTQYYTDASTVIKVSKNSFYPMPLVDSSVVKLSLKSVMPYKSINEVFFKKFNRVIFSMRRKTLVNNVICGFPFNKNKVELFLESNNISKTIRAESLSPREIVDLSNLIYLAQNDLK